MFALMNPAETIYTEECVQKLLEKKAEPNVFDNDDKSPLYFAIMSGQYLSLPAILERVCLGGEVLTQSIIDPVVIHYGYADFCRRLIPELEKEFPHSTFLEVSRKVSERWSIDKSVMVRFSGKFVAAETFNQVAFKKSLADFLKVKVSQLGFLWMNEDEVYIEMTPNHAEQINNNDMKFGKILGMPIRADIMSTPKRSKKELEEGERTQKVKFLLEHGADPNITTTSWTPLILACQRNLVPCAELLLEYGAYVDAPSNEDPKMGMEETTTPLIESMSYGCTECVKLLIQKNADVNKKTKLNRTPIGVAQVNGGMLISI